MLTAKRISFNEAVVMTDCANLHAGLIGDISCSPSCVSSLLEDIILLCSELSTYLFSLVLLRSSNRVLDWIVKNSIDGVFRPFQLVSFC